MADHLQMFWACPKPSHTGERWQPRQYNNEPGFRLLLCYYISQENAGNCPLEGQIFTEDILKPYPENGFKWSLQHWVSGTG